MRILPGLPLVWRDLNTVQIGLDPRTGTVLHGLGHNEQLFLSYLTRPHSPTELLLRAHRCKVSKERMQEIVDALSSAGVLEDPQEGPLTRRPPFAAESHSETNAEEGTTTASSTATNPAANTGTATNTGTPANTSTAAAPATTSTPPTSSTTTARTGTSITESKPPLTWMPLPISHACVHIAQLDCLGVEVALTLARMGVRSLAFGDTAIVGSNDHPALSRHWRGTKRVRAMEYFLKRECPQITLHGVPDIAVVTGSHHIDPLHAATFMALPHMLAFTEEVDTYVGPLVIPGQTPCARCMYYNYVQGDPAWAHIMPQLRHSPALVPEASTRRLAAALIARAVGIFLAYGHNCLPYHSLVLTAHEFMWKPIRVYPSAECGCMSPLPGDLPLIPFEDDDVESIDNLECFSVEEEED